MLVPKREIDPERKKYIDDLIKKSKDSMYINEKGEKVMRFSLKPSKGPAMSEESFAKYMAKSGGFSPRRINQMTKSWRKKRMISHPDSNWDSTAGMSDEKALEMLRDGDIKISDMEYPSEKIQRTIVDGYHDINYKDINNIKSNIIKYIEKKELNMNI